RLQKQMSELCERILHQGTIYSTSPPAVHELIGMAAKAKARDRALFYAVLAEFSSSARKAVRDGRAIPCCSVGGPSDGEAILREILQARDQFAPDLESPDPVIRGNAGLLLTASVDADAGAVRLVRARFTTEPDASVRGELFRGLARVPEQFGDWRE